MIKTVLSFCTMLSALGLALVARAADEHKHEEVHINEGVAVLVPMKASGVSGTLLLKQEKGFTQVSGEVSGLKPGKHGFHIHMFGDLRAADGMSAGGHYNPHGVPHGGPDAKVHHEGDLGNIEAGPNGVAKVDVPVAGVDLHYLIGRSLVVHGDVDDLKSQPAGNAGPRIAVGVIGLAEVKAPVK
jgi:Cu-Zn family superoxide dismutase